MSRSSLPKGNRRRRSISAVLADRLIAARRSDALQDRAYAGAQLAQIEGLGQIIVHAHLEAHDLVDDIVQDRQHDDRGRAGRAEPAGDGDAVLARHGDVEHDEVRGLRGERNVELGPAGASVRRVAAPAEIVDDHAADLRLVVDHDKPGPLA